MICFKNLIATLSQANKRQLFATILSHPQGLNFKAEWLDSHPKFGNLVEKNTSAGDSHPEKFCFLEVFIFIKLNSPFPKNSPIFMKYWTIS